MRIAWCVSGRSGCEWIPASAELKQISVLSPWLFHVYTYGGVV